MDWVIMALLTYFQSSISKQKLLINELQLSTNAEQMFFKWRTNKHVFQHFAYAGNIYLQYSVSFHFDLSYFA